MNSDNVDDGCSPDRNTPLRVALLGAGLFATNAHAPAIRKHPDSVQCIAVWSRRQASAEALGAEGFDGCNSDMVAYGGEQGLLELLRSPDVEAVIMALPLDTQPEAQVLRDDYHRNFSPRLQWSVAENFRYEPAIQRAAEVVRNEIGHPFLFSLNMRIPFRPDNPYLKTAWRKKPSWYGGLFVDAFVHATAMLRKILGSEARSVSAVTSSRADHLPSVDTMAARVEFQSGVQGSIATTYACSSMKFELEVTGTQGTMLLQRKQDGPGYRITVNENTVEEYGFGGVEAELLSFADACRGGRDADCNSPEEAVKDLMMVEACLKSGQNNGACITL